MTTIIRCRAKLGDQPCLDGSPASRQFGEDGPLSEDDTYDGSTIVCDACYVALMPFTMSGQGLHEELPGAMNAYRNNLAHVRGHWRLPELLEEAERAIEGSSPGSPRHEGAVAARAMVEREIKRREERAAKARAEYDCEKNGHLTIAGEDRCRACGAEAYLMCQVCAIRPAKGVASSALGPVSLAYCQDCLTNNADADFIVENALTTCGSWDQVAEWFRESQRVWRPDGRGGGEYKFARDVYSDEDIRRMNDEEAEELRRLEESETKSQEGEG